MIVMIIISKPLGLNWTAVANKLVPIIIGTIVSIKKIVTKSAGIKVELPK